MWSVPRIPAYVMGKNFFALTEAVFAPIVICTTSEYAANIHAGGSLESQAVRAMIYTHFCGNRDIILYFLGFLHASGNLFSYVFFFCNWKIMSPLFL